MSAEIASTSLLDHVAETGFRASVITAYSCYFRDRSATPGSPRVNPCHNGARRASSARSTSFSFSASSRFTRQASRSARRKGRRPPTFSASSEPASTSRRTVDVLTPRSWAAAPVQTRPVFRCTRSSCCPICRSRQNPVLPISRPLLARRRRAPEPGHASQHGSSDRRAHRPASLQANENRKTPVAWTA